MAVTPATAGPYLPHIRAASPSRGPLASYFPFLSLWLRGGVEETEVKELPTVVWGLRNTSLLILSNKKKKNLILLWMDSGCFLHPFRGKEEKAQVEG